MDETIRTAAISPLRQRLIDDMNMRRFSRETQRNYVRDVGRFATFLGRSPDRATADDLRRFQIEQQDAGVPTPTLVRVAHPRNLPASPVRLATVGSHPPYGQSDRPSARVAHRPSRLSRNTGGLETAGRLRWSPCRGNAGGKQQSCEQERM